MYLISWLIKPEIWLSSKYYNFFLNYMLLVEYEGNKCNVIPLLPQLQGSQYPNHPQCQVEEHPQCQVEEHPQCQVEEHPSKTISIKSYKNFSLLS